MYDPSTARFLTKDPLEERGGDPNLYAYCANDPVNRTDPSGQALYFYKQDLPKWEQFQKANPGVLLVRVSDSAYQVVVTTPARNVDYYKAVAKFLGDELGASPEAAGATLNAMYSGWVAFPHPGYSRNLDRVLAGGHAQPRAVAPGLRGNGVDVSGAELLQLQADLLNLGASQVSYQSGKFFIQALAPNRDTGKVDQFNGEYTAEEAFRIREALGRSAVGGVESDQRVQAQRERQAQEAQSRELERRVQETRQVKGGDWRERPGLGGGRVLQTLHGSPAEKAAEAKALPTLIAAAAVITAPKLIPLAASSWVAGLLATGTAVGAGEYADWSRKNPDKPFALDRDSAQAVDLARQPYLGAGGGRVLMGPLGFARGYFGFWRGGVAPFAIGGGLTVDDYLDARRQGGDAEAKFWLRLGGGFYGGSRGLKSFENSRTLGENWSWRPYVVGTPGPKKFSFRDWEGGAEFLDGSGQLPGTRSKPSARQEALDEWAKEIAESHAQGAAQGRKQSNLPNLEDFDTSKGKGDLSKYKKLNIASGGEYDAPDALHLNIELDYIGEVSGGKIKADYTKMPEVPTNHFPEVVGRNVQFNTPDEIAPTVKEIFRVTRPGGTIRISFSSQWEAVESALKDAGFVNVTRGVRTPPHGITFTAQKPK